MAQLLPQIMGVNNIIARALALIGAESVYQAENADARNFALDTLNDILAQMATDAQYVPFFLVYEFPLIGGQPDYSLGTTSDSEIILPQPIQAIDYVSLSLNGYRYPVIIEDNFGTYGTSRFENISGLPNWVGILAAQDKITLKFYPKPSLAYVCQLIYKQNIARVEYQMAIALPESYRSLLVYWLGKRVNFEGRFGNWTPDRDEELKNMIITVKSAMPVDNRVRSQPPYMPGSGWYNSYIGVRR